MLMLWKPLTDVQRKSCDPSSGIHAHPPSILSSCLLPVEILMTLFRMASTSIPEMNGVWLGYVESTSSVFDCHQAVHKVTYQTFSHSILNLGNLDLTETLNFL